MEGWNAVMKQATAKVVNGPGADAQKKALADDADDAAATPSKTPSAGFLPTGLSRAIVIGTTLICITFAATVLLCNRYSLVAAVKSENVFVYRIDRLTGGVMSCGQASCTPVALKAD
jgi:hypothetical protein